MPGFTRIHTAEVMMLSHQQMGHDAARAVGEHDATMDNFVISQDWTAKVFWNGEDQRDSNGMKGSIALKKASLKC